ncbi:MAG: hypothetical protein L0Z48_10200 [candidate division Zixibacteria bacterium]|nr:hypothetical protein [candidate division Zixibacteria bacterium]
MKKKPLALIFSFSLFGFNVLLINTGHCQKQCPAKPYDFSKDAPKSINDECKKGKKKYLQMLKEWNPKALQDPSALEQAGLRIESSWNGYLDFDSVRYWIIYYRCFDSGFLTILKTNKQGNMILVWQSPDIGSELSGLQEPEDLINDGRKEIFLYRGGGSGGGYLDLYTWTGDSASFVGQFDDGTEFKDLDDDGIAEVIESYRLEMPVDSTYKETEFYTETKIYRWIGQEYQLLKKLRSPLPKPKER